MTDLMLITVVVFLLAQCADVITTMQALKRGGRERNRVIAWLMEKLGYGWVAVKLAVSLGAFYLLWTSGNGLWVWALAAITAYVAYRNHRVSR